MNPEGQKELTTEFLEEVVLDHASPDDIVRTRSEDFIREATDRIVTEGARQYFDEATDQMRFEVMPIDELFAYAEEEALDVANYAAMLHARAEYAGEEIFTVRLATQAHRTWLMVREARELAAAARNGVKAQTRLAQAARFAWEEGDIEVLPQAGVREE